MSEVKLRAVLDLATGGFKRGLGEAEKEAAGSSKRMAKTFGAVGKAWAGISVGVAASSAKAAADFEKNMAEVDTILGKGSEKTVERLKGQLLALGPEFGKTENLVKGLYQTISAGVAPEKAVGFIKDAQKLATAGLAGLDDTVLAMTKVMSGMQVDAEKSKTIADLLFTTVQKGQTTLPELATAIPRVTALAGNMGVPLTELFATTAELTKTLPSTAESMSGLKQALASISKPSKEAADMAAELNLQIGENAIKAAGGWVSYLEEVKAKTAGKDGAMSALFGGVEGKNTVLALIDNIDRLKQTNSEMTEAAKQDGAIVEEAFRKQRETVAGAVSEMAAAFEKIQIELGEQFLPTIAAASKEIADNIGIIKAALEFLLIPVKALAGVGSGIGAIAGSTVALGQGVVNSVTGNGPGVGEVAGRLGEQVSKAPEAGLGRRVAESLPLVGPLLQASRITGGFAEGTKSAPGGTALVGEQGPELVNLPRGSEVLTAGQTKAALGSKNPFGVGGPMGASLPGTGLKNAIANLFGAGAAEGSMEGLKRGTKAAGGGGERGKPSGVGGILEGFIRTGATTGIQTAFEGGDVTGSMENFARQFGEGMKRELVMNLKRTLSSKLISFLGLGGFNFAGFASGGITPGGPVIVGERGPELVDLPRGSRVHSHQASQAMGMGGFNFAGMFDGAQFNFGHGSSPEQAGEQFGEGFFRGMAQAVREGRAVELEAALGVA